MKILLIVAQEGYRDEEYDIPKKIFEKAGYEVITCSKKVGKAVGKLGGSTPAVISIDDLDVLEYDAVVFVGGPGCVSFQHDVEAHMTAQEAVNEEKVLAAICWAPTILALAGVLDGKKATVKDSDGTQRKILEDNGATYISQPVVIDGKIITADGPESAEKFAKKIIEVLERR